MIITNEKKKSIVCSIIRVDFDDGWIKLDEKELYFLLERYIIKYPPVKTSDSYIKETEK